MDTGQAPQYLVTPPRPRLCEGQALAPPKSMRCTAGAPPQVCFLMTLSPLGSSSPPLDVPLAHQCTQLLLLLLLPLHTPLAHFLAETQGSFPALPPRRSAVMNTTVICSLQEGSAARVLQHGHGARLVRVLRQNKPFPNEDLAAADHEVQPPGGSLAQLVPGNLRRSGAAGSRILGWRALLLEVRCSEAHRPNIEDEIFPHSRHHEILPCYTTPHCIYTTRHCINTTSYHTTAHHTVLH